MLGLMNFIPSKYIPIYNKIILMKLSYLLIHSLFFFSTIIYQFLVLPMIFNFLMKGTCNH